MITGFAVRFRVLSALLGVVLGASTGCSVDDRTLGGGGSEPALEGGADHAAGNAGDASSGRQRDATAEGSASAVDGSAPAVDAGKPPQGGASAEGGGSIDGASSDGSAVACTPSDKRCNPAGTGLQQCDLSGVWNDTTSCPFGCAGSGSAAACAGMCQPGTRSCGANNTPALCDTTGTAQPETPCPNVCVDGQCTGDCKPGATRCAAGSTTMVQTCDAAGHWGAAQACTYVCDAVAHQCGGECAPGAANRCLSNAVQACDATGHWTTTSTCTTTPCSMGQCRACNANDKQCNGGKPQTCSALGVWTDDQPTACPFVCDATTGKCAGECVPGTDACGAGQVTRHCGATGTYDAGTTCPNVCDATGRCGGVCSPNAHRCNGSSAETCSTAGQWPAGISCPFGCNATSGLCNPCTDESVATTCGPGKCGPTQNNCMHTVQCSPTCSGTGQTCGGLGVPGMCGCPSESTTAFCMRLSKTCGSVSGTDNCGAARTATCGSCASPQVCEPATGPAPNTCCTPETDAAICTRLARACGTMPATDTCGTSRTPNCGNCNTLTLTATAPNSVTFPPINVATGVPATQTYVLRNAGAQPTNNVAISLTGSAFFSLANRITGDCVNGMPLAANTSCNVRVTFAPTVGGTFLTALQASASPLGGTVSLNLQGVGQTPPTLTLVAAQGSSTGFGFYVIGSSTPKEEFYLLTNTGSLSTSIVNLTFVSDTSMGGFRFSQTAPGDCPVDALTDAQNVALQPLTPNQSCNVHVQFSTFTSNSFSAILVADDTTPPPPTTDPGHASLTLTVQAVLQ